MTKREWASITPWDVGMAVEQAISDCPKGVTDEEFAAWHAACQAVLDRLRAMMLEVS